MTRGNRILSTLMLLGLLMADPSGAVRSQGDGSGEGTEQDLHHLGVHRCAGCKVNEGFPGDPSGRSGRSSIFRSRPI